MAVNSIPAVFMIITSISHPDEAQISLFLNMKECQAALPKVTASLKKNKDIDSIECIEGDLVKEERSEAENPDVST